MSDGYYQRQIWDPLIRVWHWTLAVAVTTGWLLGEFRDFETIRYHMYLGYAVGGLLLLRIVWGVVGSPVVRFRALWFSIPALVDYTKELFRRSPSGFPGHSPIGALSVMLMLFALVVQVVTGLFAEDDGLFSEGPLAWMLSSNLQGLFDTIHRINAEVLLFLVGIHVAAIFFYLVWKRENLIKPMVTGWKAVQKDREE